MVGYKYKTIYADPPWPIKWHGDARIGKKPLDYPTMTVAELCLLPVKSIAADDCALFLWATNQFLPEAFGVVRAWGFQYQLLWTWCKNNGVGGLPRNATEHLLIARRGTPACYDRHAKAVLNWAVHPRLEHSQKPEMFRDYIELCSPEPRIELFARVRHIGWHSWGNEVDSDISLGSCNEQEFAPPTAVGRESEEEGGAQR